MGSKRSKKSRTAEAILRDLVAALELLRQARAPEQKDRCRLLAEKFYQELHEVDHQERGG